MNPLRASISIFEALVRKLRSRFAWVAVQPFPWKTLAQQLIWFHWAFETYILYRQYGNYSKKDIPSSLAGHIDAETFLKSQNYGRDKAKFFFWTSLFHQTISSLDIHYNFYAWAWTKASALRSFFRPNSRSQIVQTLFFIFIIVTRSTLLQLPFHAYMTFGVEAKHGFNDTTVSTFATDMIKFWMIALVLGAPFFSAFLYVVEWAGDSFIPFLMVLSIIYHTGFVVIFPTFIQPLFNKLSPLPEGELKTRLERLASSLDYPLSKLYTIDSSKRSSHSNAYMYGIPWRKHIVIFDTLLEQNAPSEIEAIVAHELGHWFYNHPMKLVMLFQLNHLFTLTSFSIFQHSPPLLKSFGFSDQVAAKPPTLIAFWLSQTILTPIISVFIFMITATSRHFEWQADLFAADLPRRVGEKLITEVGLPSMGDRLGAALIALYANNLADVWVDWLFSAYRNPHPTLPERLRELEAYKTMAAAREGHKEL